jgi:hypothetical protein
MYSNVFYKKIVPLLLALLLAPLECALASNSPSIPVTVLTGPTPLTLRMTDHMGDILLQETAPGVEPQGEKVTDENTNGLP